MAQIPPRKRMIANPLNESSLAFPVLECLHIVGFVGGVGTMALVNFRLLGVGLTQKSAAQLWRDTMPWTLGGLSLVIVSGFLLFSIDPDVYYLNVAFLLKMLFLVVAILFYYTGVRRAASSRIRAGGGQVAACISLGLWALVLFGGIFIGFTDAKVRPSPYTYPVLLSVHMVALAFFGGMILVTDLRLLGLGMRSYTIAEVVSSLRAPKRFGFVVAAASGALMFASKAGQYSYNRWFWIKLALIGLIAVNYVIFRRSVYRRTAELDRSPQIPGRAKMAAGLSLLLWACVACAGRGPATIKDIMHSMVDPSGDFLFKSVQQIADEHGVTEKAPKTDEEWEDVRERLAVLLEAPDLLTAKGRMAAHPKDRSKNPQVENEPEEVQKLIDAGRPDFIRRASRLHDAAAVAMKAVDAKDKNALFHALDGIDRACEGCHLHYWYPKDQRAQEAARENGNTE
jgi:hypothetical protein